MRWRQMLPIVNRGILLIMLLLTLVGAASVAWAQEAVDINAAGFTIPVLANGSRVDGTFQGPVTARLYGFQGSAGDVVTVTMTQVSDQLDPFLVLLGADGEFIASDDDSGATLLSAAIEDVTLPVDGAYLVLATSIHHVIEPRTEIPESLTFNLSLNGNTLPADADPAVLPLFVVPLEPGEPVAVTLGPEQVAAYFSAPVGVDSAFGVTVEESSFDTVLHLFDSTGARLAVNDDDASREGLASGLYDAAVPTAGGALAIVSDVFFYMDDQDRTESEMRPFTGGDMSVLLQAG
ncbi:MAG: hypothetical protein IPK19_13425 [Chloroflexi bacterium]|nr:hypothetical protein [Chloroflexota bacterium]